MRRRWTHRIEALACVVLVCAVPVVAFWPSVTQGQWPWSPAPLYELPPWEEAASSGDVLPSFLDHQFVHQYLPWYAFISQSAASGQSVLWNPYEGGGTPFLAAWRTRCLSPFSIPVYVLPLDRALIVSLIAKVLVAGCLSLLAARRFGIVWAPALLVSLSYATSPALLLWAASPVSDAVPWIPLACIAMEQVRTRRLVGCIQFAVALALIVLGGAPGTALFLSLVALAYVLIMALRTRSLFQGIGWFTGSLSAVLMAIGLAAIQILPAAELFPLLAPPGADFPTPSLRFSDALAALLPPPAAAIADGSPWSRFLNPGLVILVLFPLWLSVRRFISNTQRRSLESLAAAMVGIAAIWLACYLIFPPNRFTLFATPEYVLVALALPFALLAAGALQEWTALDAQETRHALKWLALLLPVTILLLVAALFTPQARANGVPWSFNLLYLAGPSAAVALLLTWTLLRPSVRLLGYGVALVAAAVSLLGLRPAQHFSPPAAFFPETVFLTTLAERGGRVSGTSALRDWPLSLQGTAQFYAASGIELDRHRMFTEAADGQPLLMRRSGSQALLLTREDIQGTFAGVRPNLRIEHVFGTGAVLFNDLAMNSRARMVYDPPRPIESPNPGVISASAPPVAENPIPPETTAGPQSTAIIRPGETHTRLDISVANTKPGMLVVADAYYPGWFARVNGKDTPIYPVDVLFRGVTLGAGPHEITLYYAPPAVLWGAGISIGTLLLSATILLASVRQWRKN